MPASPAGASPSQLDPSQFHPEFGYLAPTIRFRRQVALTLKGAALGTLLGAVAMFFVVMDREDTGLAMLAAPMLSTPTQAAAADKPVPVLFVPESIALPAAAPGPSQGPSQGPSHVRGVAPAAVAAVAATPVTPELPAVVAPLATPAVASAEEPALPAIAAPSPLVIAVAPAPAVAAAAPAPVVAKVVAKRKRKIVREPARTVHPVPVEVEGRTAFAGPYRRFGEPYAPGYGRPLFGLGW